MSTDMLLLRRLTNRRFIIIITISRLHLSTEPSPIAGRRHRRDTPAAGWRRVQPGTSGSRRR